MAVSVRIHVCSKLETPVALPFSYLEYRVETVLWKDDGRVALVEKAYYFLAEKK